MIEIKIKIGDQELSMDEARKLYDELREIFEKKAAPISTGIPKDWLKPLKPAVEPYPIYPYPKPTWIGPYRPMETGPRWEWDPYNNPLVVTCKSEDSTRLI